LLDPRQGPAYNTDMPKATFHNLPEEKRSTIVHIAMKEFARYDYKRASLSRIVEKAGIAKGSMYQYFADKRDLYLYLINLASDEKLSHISTRIGAGSGDHFFSRFESILFEGTLYDFTHPTTALLLLNGMNEPVSEELGRISFLLTEGSRNYLSQFVTKGIQAGDIRRDLDTDLIITVINQATLGIKEYLESKYRFSVVKHLGKREIRLPIKKEVLITEIRSLVELIRRGIGNRST
jgi:AcrR family transcriptional regulator